MKRIAFLVMAVVSFLSGCQTSKESNHSNTPGSSHLLNTTAITEVFGDGQKVTALALEYDTVIDASSLDVSDFSVSDQQIIRIYTNSIAEKAAESNEGNFVVMEFYIDTTMPIGGPAPGPNSSPGQVPPQGGDMRSTDETDVPLSVVFSQTGNITSLNGADYTGDNVEKTSENTINLIVDDFQQFVFTDPSYDNKTLMYNLYVPENYDPDKSYPLVLFMPDASATSTIPTKGITQGLGAVAKA